MDRSLLRGRVLKFTNHLMIAILIVMSSFRAFYLMIFLRFATIIVKSWRLENVSFRYKAPLEGRSLKKNL